MHDDDRNNIEDAGLAALLRDYPAPAPEDGFFEQALVRATHEGARRQRNRWLATGFGGAIAATLAVWLVGGMLLGNPGPDDGGPAIPDVSIALEQPKTINLVFASATALDSATLTVNLPDGIELSGFPGQRVITWETSLKEGRNLLPLTLVAVTGTGGELLARLEHDNRDRTFRLQVDVT